MLKQSNLSQKNNNKLIHDLGLKNIFVILIAGTLGYVQGISTVVNAA